VILLEEHTDEGNQPQPCEAFGHPVTKLVMHEVSNHSPGFEESVSPAYSCRAAEFDVIPPEMPPWNPDKIPREGVAERIIQLYGHYLEI
jgi:hypothetical protein